jgi:hypothetical protein
MNMPFQKTSRLRVGVFLTLLLASVALFTSTAHAQSGTTIVVSPAVRLIQNGSVGAVDIVINDYNDPNPVGPNGKGLYGADVRFTFDKNIVTVQDDNPFQSGVQVTPGPLLASGNFINLFNTADNAAGTIMFVITQSNPTPPVFCPTPPTPCSGVLMTIHFKGNAPGTSPVNFTYQKLTNPNGFQIPATTTNGVINVYTPTSAGVTEFGGARVGNTQARLTWTTGSEIDLLGFNVWRSENEDAGYTQRNSALIPTRSPGEIVSNAYELLDGGLAQAKTYYYRLEVIRAVGDAEWMGPILLEKDGACAGKPSRVELLAPPDGATVAQVARLGWTGAACADAYRVQIRQDAVSGPRAANALVRATDWSASLESGHLYYWRVRTLAGKRHSAWSEWGTFAVR